MDTQPGFPDGAEDSVYTSLTPPHLAANMTITRVERAHGAERLRRRALREARAIRHGAARSARKLNVCTAPGIVLDSLDRWRPRIQPQSGGSREAPRGAAAFRHLRELQGALGDEEYNKVKDSLTESSNYFRANVWVTIGTTQFTLYSLLVRGGTGPRPDDPAQFRQRIAPRGSMAETLVIRLRAAPEAPASWLIVDANGARSGPARSGTGRRRAAARGRPARPAPAARLRSYARRARAAAARRRARGAGRTLRARGTPRLRRRGSALRDRQPRGFGDRHAGRRGRARPHGSLDRKLRRPPVIAPQAAYADSAVVPVAPNGCTLLLDETALYVRRANAMPFVLDAEPLATALDIALGAAVRRRRAAASTSRCYVSPGEYESNRDLIEGLRPRTASLQVKLMTEGALAAARRAGGRLRARSTCCRDRTRRAAS